jgi:hypothetical protein
MGWRVAEVVELLSSNCEALSSNSSTARRRRRIRRDGRCMEWEAFLGHPKTQHGLEKSCEQLSELCSVLLERSTKKPDCGYSITL